MLSRYTFQRCGRSVFDRKWPFFWLRRPEDDDFDMEEELRKLQPQRPLRQPDLEPRSRRALVEDPRVSVIPEGDASDSGEDSDGPILYRDDDDVEEDDDDDEPLSTSLHTR